MTAAEIISRLDEAIARSPKRVGLIRVSRTEHRILYGLQEGILRPYDAVDWSKENINFRGIPLIAQGAKWVRHEGRRERARRAFRQALEN